jgi:sulfopyruvate decarboxylase subunit beta
VTARMSAKEALVAVHSHRGERDVVVTTMATSRDWMTLSQSPLDVVFVPSAMGHATSIGLGLALAQPSRRVIVCNGDGSMLMNLVILLFDNGVYEVTGAQPTPAPAGVDYSAIARGAGCPSVFAFDSIDGWRAGIERTLNAPGPVFAWLRVEPVTGIAGPRSPGPAADRGRRLTEALTLTR